MEVDPDSAKKDIRGFAKSKAAQKTKKMVGNFGIGEEELAGLKLGELLDNPPPGLDEAVALAKVVEFITDDAYAKFTRIVFDTAPTGGRNYSNIKLGTGCFPNPDSKIISLIFWFCLYCPHSLVLCWF